MKYNIMNMKKRMFLILGLLMLMVTSSFALTAEILNTDPSPIVAGDYADITIRFTNTAVSSNNNDNILTDVYFEVEKTDLILPVSSSLNRINKLLNGESVTRTFRVYFSDDLKQGNINLPVIIGYNGIKIKKDLSIFILDSLSKPDLYIGKINTIPNELLQDSKNNKLDISLQNLGDKSADLVKAELVVDKRIIPSYSYSMQDSVSSIKGNSQNNLEFVVDIEKNVSGNVPAKLKLRYRTNIGVDSSDYKIYSKVINFTIPVTPAPYLVVDSVESLTDMKIGTTEQKIKVRIRNDGLEDANEVRVRIVPDISYPFIFEKTTQYVASKIKPGDYADVIYKLEITKDAEAKNYSSIVVIESLVEDSRYSREDIVTILPVENEKTSKSVIAYIIVVLIILVSLIIGANTYIQNRAENKKIKITKKSK